MRRPCAYTCWEDSFAKGTSKGLRDSRDTRAIEELAGPLLQALL